MKRLLIIVLLFLSMGTAVAQKQSYITTNIENAANEYNKGNYDAARLWLIKEMDENPTNPLSYTIASKIYSMVGYTEGAFNVLDEGLYYINPQDTIALLEIYKAQIELFGQEGLYENSNSIIYKYLAIKESAELRDILIAHHEEISEPWMVLKETETAIANTTDPEYLQRFYFTAAEYAYMTQDNEKAMMYIKKLHELLPNYIGILPLEGVIRIEMGDYEEGFNKIISVMNSDEDMYSEFAASFLSELGVDLLDICIERYTRELNNCKEDDKMTWHYIIINTYINNKLYEQAYNYIIQNNIQNEIPPYEIASILSQCSPRYMTTAMQHIDEALAQDATNTLYNITKLAILLNMGSYEEVITLSDQILQSSEEGGNLYTIRGFAHENTGNFDTAIEEYTMAIWQTGDMANMLFRGHAYLLKGDTDLAENDFNTIIGYYQYHPQDDILAYTYALSGQPDKAIETINKIEFDLPLNKALAFNKMYTILNNEEMMAKTLQEAINLGFRHFDKIGCDPLMENARNNARIQEIIATYNK